MKYDAVTEIITILRINENHTNNNINILKQNLKYLTKELNFELGNIEEVKYESYRKKININNKEIIITISTKSNEIEISYQEKNDYISLKFDNDLVYLNTLNIKYNDEIYILDKYKKKINYYDKETLDYICNKRQTIRKEEEYYLDQNSIEKYGIIPDEEIYLNNDNTEQIIIFKKIITNSKKENKIYLKEMKNNKEKPKSLIKKHKIN